jgi:hypothetical protein
VSHTVDQEAARTADTLPAVVFEGHRGLLPAEEVLIEGVEHFKK